MSCVAAAASFEPKALPGEELLGIFWERRSLLQTRFHILVSAVPNKICCECEKKPGVSVCTQNLMPKLRFHAF